jgi:hypothetical protein
MDRKSPYYLRSSFSKEINGDDNRTEYSRELVVEGNDPDYTRATAAWAKAGLMP